MTRCACLVFALVLAAVPALANIPYPALCVLNNAAGSDGAVVFNLPNGAGRALTEANVGGTAVDATLTLTVVNSEGNPIAAYPAEDIWLVTTGGSFTPCADVHPDAATDSNGQTTWTAAIAAGGSSIGEDVRAVIAGDNVPDTATIHFVSADMNGDLAVNLTDITAFTPALGGYAPAADFNADGNVNLTDITMFVPGLGVSCP